MKKILLDTNMFIYIEDYAVIDEKVATLTKRLFDSDEYKIVIHPKTKREIMKLSNETQKEIFLSKISVYSEIKSPPIPDDKFIKIVGCKNEHDAIDNELLFSVFRNCVEYLITNDIDLLKKAKKVGLDNRVLSIEKALETFREIVVEDVRRPIFIDKKFLHELDINDSFFDSLKKDYPGFGKWFQRKQGEGAQAYVTEDNGKITSFLMLKIEDKNEDYSDFAKPFLPAKRLKISTLKVNDSGKRIGESFIKLIVEEAIRNDVDEIYVTTFSKQVNLIDKLEEYGFCKYTKKKCPQPDGTYKLEEVLVKSMKNKEEFYPFFSINKKRIFIVPIKEKYHRLLFQDSEKQVQLQIDDFHAMNVASNAIKKAYLCNSKITKIQKGSIVLFYSSGIKKCITSLGIVDAVFNKFKDFDEMYNLVRKRTAYEENELKKNYRDNKLVILFKLFYPFDNYVDYRYLLDNGIISGAIQSIQEINKTKLLKILEKCKMNKDIYLIDSNN